MCIKSHLRGAQGLISLFVIFGSDFGSFPLYIYAQRRMWGQLDVFSKDNKQIDPITAGRWGGGGRFVSIVRAQNARVPRSVQGAISFFYALSLCIRCAISPFLLWH